jgi:hypothetical protein
MTLSRYLARSHLKTRMRNQVGGHRPGIDHRGGGLSFFDSDRFCSNLKTVMEICYAPHNSSF